MSSPSHSPSHQQAEDDQPQDEESQKPHPSIDLNPQTLEEETPNQQIPQLVIDEQCQQHEEIPENSQGMTSVVSSSSSFPPAPFSVDYPPAITTPDAPIHVAAAAEADAVQLPSFKALFHNKRKKGKPNVKKQQAIEKKYQTLLENLNPIPFSPSKIPDFSKHEGILKRLGLWDFVNIDFSNSVKVDLVAQLIACYDPKGRCSYVNGARITVSRADIARALKLPLKKSASSVVVDGVELVLEELTGEEKEDVLGVIEEVLSNWVLLHEDTWILPSEVLNWTNLIKDGHPEKVDWAGLFWFMVEKELAQGEQLRDCHYAPHLQHLIKTQHAEVFLEGEPQRVELDVEAKEDEFGGKDGELNTDDVKEVQEEEGLALERSEIELTLGQDGGEKEEVKDAEMMDAEEGKEDEEDEEQGQWFLDGKNNDGDHLLQRCNMDLIGRLENDEEKKEDVQEIEEEKLENEENDGFDVDPNDDTLVSDGLTGNLLEAMDTSQVAFASQEQFHDQSAMELLASRNDMQHTRSAGPSYFGSGGKRLLDHDHDMSYDNLNGSNKRVRTNSQWHDEPPDFRSCMDQIKHLTSRASMMFEAREQSEQQLNMQQQMLFSELEKRESAINHLQMTKSEEIRKRDEEIYRLERELYIMGNLVDGYRKALKGIQRTFDEYRQQVKLPEEPIYKDAGPGGLMLTTAEIERQRLKQEEEYQLNCIMLEQKAKEAEEEYVGQFSGFLEEVDKLNKRLESIENKAKLLKELLADRKISKADQQVSENPECPPNE